MTATSQTKTPRMETFRIPGADLSPSRIGLGTWAIGGWMWGGTDKAESIRTIHAALDRGITLIDTAPVYGFGHSEEIVGKALAEGGRRGRVVLATKVGLDWKDKQQAICAATIRNSGRRISPSILPLYPHSTVSRKKTSDSSGATLGARPRSQYDRALGRSPPRSARSGRRRAGLENRCECDGGDRPHCGAVRAHADRAGIHGAAGAGRRLRVSQPNLPRPTAIGLLPPGGYLYGCWRHGDVDSGEIWTVNSRGLTVTIATAVLIACCVEGAIAQPPTDRMAQVSSQQPCDPLIDGTYCATQGGRLSSTAPSQVSMAPIQSLGGDLSLGQTQPGTLGAITFNGGGTICIGLLRRGACN